MSNLTREALLRRTLWLHDLHVGTDRCDRKYVEVCKEFQSRIFEAGDQLRDEESQR